MTCSAAQAPLHASASRAAVVALLVLASGTARAATLAEIVAGDLVITEVMADPSMVEDYRGEWFEVYNASGVDVDLDGLVLSDDGTDSYTVSGALTVAAGGSVVFAVNGDSAVNGGIPAADYVYTRSLMRFDNGSDELTISYGDTTFDSVRWGTGTSFTVTPGVTFSLDLNNLDATSNDNPYFWCDASTSYGLGDLGTPGDSNDDCGLTGVTVADLERGDLVITEVMVDPTQVDDALGEWFEVYVSTEVPVNLYGLVLSDGGTDSYTLVSDYTAEPGEYVLLAVKSDPAKNGELPTVAMTWVRSTFRFDNGADEIALSNGAVTIDEVAWTKSSGLTAGATWSLDPGSLHADLNDTDDAFCAGAATYGLGDLGTPGAANDACPMDVDGDGYVDGEDCNDADATVYPGAAETCNDIDDDCDDVVDDDATDAATWSLDYDQDGYGGSLIQELACDNPNESWYADNADDCDDRDASAFPGGAEVCDEADNDCDGTTDEDAADTSTWYADADADGYGDAATTSAACDAADGYVDNALDCDDTSASAYPGADETCNAADDDCDGDADNDPIDGLTWYLDYDDDGYGATKITAVACEAPTYFVSNAEDCDDLEPEISPAAEEVCADWIDNNCDDSALDCSVTGDVDLSEADAKFTGDTTYTDAGRGLAGLGDMNGDGYGDIAIGAPATALDDDATSTGAAYVIYGPVTGTAALSAVAGGTLTGEAGGDQAGYSLAPAGDANGDGYADLLVGARDESTVAADAGAVYFVSGPVTGTASLSTADAKMTGEAASNIAGFVVSSGSDIDLDGTPDVATGAYGNSTAATEAGAVYVSYGPLSGTSSLGAAGGVLYGEAADDRAGRWVSSEGDVDGDGGADVLVGAYASDGDGSTADAGRAYLVYGAVSGALGLADADAIFTGEQAGHQAGYTVENGGDVDGDGYADLLITAVYENSVGTRNGAAYVVYGPPSGSLSLSSADVKLTGVAAGDHAGVRASYVHDANGDGRDEVLVAAFGEDTGGVNAGAAYITYGPLTGSISLSAADGRFIGEAEGDRAGSAVSFADDTNGDGYGDLLVGAVQEGTGGTDAGAAYLILGSGW